MRGPLAPVSMPSTRSVPEVTGETQLIMRMVEDLPAPLGPRKPNASPRRSSNRTPSTARERAGGAARGIGLVEAVRLHQQVKIEIRGHGRSLEIPYDMLQSINTSCAITCASGGWLRKPV